MTPAQHAVAAAEGRHSVRQARRPGSRGLAAIQGGMHAPGTAALPRPTASRPVGAKGHSTRQSACVKANPASLGMGERTLQGGAWAVRPVACLPASPTHPQNLGGRCEKTITQPAPPTAISRAVRAASAALRPRPRSAARTASIWGMGGWARGRHAGVMPTWRMRVSGRSCHARPSPPTPHLHAAVGQQLLQAPLDELKHCRTALCRHLLGRKKGTGTSEA